jgi:hypothetical protein
MKRQKLEIGQRLRVSPTWYDSVPEAPRLLIYEGQVIGYGDSQVPFVRF